MNTTSYQFCHGSTYSALYLMSRLPGDNKNCLVPFGLLESQKIPTFSGECFRGIAENGINRESTSWAPITSDSLAVSYSKKFPFSFKENKEYFEEIIRDNDNRPSRPPYATTFHSAYWNKFLLRIRQIRAWDEPTFQKELREGLLRWIQSEIRYFEEKGKEEAPDKEQGAILGRMQKIQDEIQGAPSFQLNEEDKQQISKTYPIVFLARLEEERRCFFSSLLDEIAVTKKLKLGEDIREIATEPQFMDEVKALLQLQGLARKVKVISFPALALEKLSHSMQ